MNTSTAASPPATPTLRLVCSEVWGGNRPINGPVELPGIRGVLYSNPCDGGRGGDVHYLSVCGSGLLSRVCLADVAGHGQTVAAIGSEMHHHLRRCMNEVDQRKVLSRLNQRLEALGLRAMTTAAAITYYPPTRTLSVSYAGHPPGWFFSKSSNTWTRLTLDEPEARALVNMPLAIESSARFTRRAVKVDIGDRLLLVTDGVLEAPSPARVQFGDEGVEQVLSHAGPAPCADIGQALMNALVTHCHVAQPPSAVSVAAHAPSSASPRKSSPLSHDDVTFAILEFVPGPTEPGWWLAIRNRVTRPRGNSTDPPFAA